VKQLLANPRTRAAVTYGGSALVTLLLLFVVFPGTAGGGRGTPLAIVFQGLVQGLVASLTAVGIVLIYRTIRIINFAQAAIGGAGGLLAFRLVQFTPTPFPIALILGTALAAVTGLLVGLLAIRFQKAPRLVLTVLTILLSAALPYLSSRVESLPFFPPAEFRSLEEQSGTEAISEGIPFAGFEFTIGDLEIPFGFAEVFGLEMAIFALLIVAALFRWTRIGVAVRGVSENAERASLLGISVGKLSCIIWALAGALSGLAIILTGIVSSPAAAQGVGPTLLIPALAGAVLGKMRSLPVAAAATTVIVLLEAAFNWSFRDDGPLFSVALLLVIGAGLLIQRRQLLRSEAATEASSWVAAQEQRPIPRVLLRVPGVRIARWAIIGVGILVVGLYPFVVGTGATNLGGVVAIQSMVIISLVVLTGWAGQVSLGQYALTGVGAVVGGALTNRVGIPFWFAVPLAALIVAAVAVVVGLPALRIRGLFLLAVTFAFAFAVERAFFSERYFGWLQPERVDRPSFFFIDFEDERSMYYLCVAALVLVIFLVSAMRRSRVGRILIGVRDNEPNLRAFGIGPVRAKLMAFAISGGIAGFAGAIFAHQQRGISAESFTATASLDTFIAAVFGGIGSVGGALIGSFWFNAIEYVISEPLIVYALVGAGPLFLLYAAPGGVISLVTSARDSVLSIVAQRRQLVVPGMREDLDVMAGIWPLADPLPRTGLASLPAGTKFTVDSGMYGEIENAPAVGRDRLEAAVFEELEESLEESSDLAFAPPVTNGDRPAVGAGRR
jgi:branched-chain amino acid transport system permease protein